VRCSEDIGPELVFAHGLNSFSCEPDWLSILLWVLLDYLAV
jgi:hypothetical protein